MNKIIIFVSIFFIGCYTPNKAKKQLNKAQVVHPEIVAKMTSQWYPCITKVQGIDSSENKVWNSTVDSANKVIYKYIIDTIIQKDSSCDSVSSLNKKLNKKISSANSIILGLQKIINKPAPVIYRDVLVTDVAKDKAYQGEISKLQSEKDVLYEKSNRLHGILLWIILALVVSLLINFIRFR